MGKRSILVQLGLLVTLVPIVYGQLSTADKQALLDLHNKRRGTVGAADILQSVWDPELAATAQSYAEECHHAPNPSVTTASGARRGENLWYSQGRASLLEGAVESLRNWVEHPGSPQYIQAVWWNVSAIGCGAFQCPRLSLSGGGRVYNASFTVCYYLTVYIADTPPFTPGDKCSKCPNSYSSCDSNGLCATSPADPVVEDDTTPPPTITRRVSWRTPVAGSVGGGTRIFLFGTGFSGDQTTGTNEVYLTSGDTVVPCDVQVYYSTSTQIVCDTRPIPDGQEWRSWSFYVRVRDGEGAEWEEVDTSCCRFQQRNNYSPWLERFSSYAGEPSSLIDIFGRIFTIAFDDTPEDPPLDVITRVTVGNRLCNHVNEDGELYGAVMTSNSRGSITCLTNTSNIIDSMNVTLTLEIRGSSIVRLSENIIGIDNKLRPYSYQTHADRGSVEGGTTITVTTSVDLSSYRQEEVQVYVGGRECEGVVITESGSIQCTTPSQPPDLPYYPGGRGLLREVWRSPPTIWNLDYFLTEPLSPENSVQERAYRDNSDPREFGENTYFVQRYTGFFVPPVTSVYTFGIISDNLNRLYVSPTADAGDKRLIARADQRTRGRWDFFDSQTSEPMMMERGKYYYMEAYSNNGGGPWSIGISAKIHSIPYTTYPYYGDREIQRILTTSTVLEETHTILLTVTPSVYDIDILYANQEGGACDITIGIGDNLLTLDPDTPTSDLNTIFNGILAIQEAGGVTVEKRAGLTDDGYNRVLLRFIFMSSSENPEEETLTISVISNPDKCTNITSRFTQLQTTPTFQLGFPDSTRQTRPLPVTEVTAEELQTGLETLLSYECTKTSPPNLLVETGYEEESEGGGVVRTRAYCGRQSRQSPSVIWEGNSYRTNLYSHVCFASLSYGTLPALAATVHYYTGDERVGTDISFDLRQNCPDWPTSSAGVWQHVCINLNSCLRNYDEEGQLFQVGKLTFSGGTFWIDEFSISPGSIEVTHVAVPISPGGVQLSAVTVTGVPTSPSLLPILPDSTHNSYLSNNLTLGPIPRLVVSEFQITYTAVNCGSGMTLIEGDQSDSSEVLVERVQAGTPGITGTFDLSFSGREIRGLPADVSADTLKQLLNANYPNEGGFSVTLGGLGCQGRWWDVSWLAREADVPSMTANGTNLVGTDPMVSVVTLIDGGMWLRPLRGDMLRLPELSPQVEVIVNDIPSSCRSQNCSFNYSTEATPLIQSVIPSSGQQGTTVTLYGSDFLGDSDDGEGVRVWLGEAECVVTSVNESEITCTVQNHWAGQVRVSAHVPGRGYAAVNESVCFTYRLSLLQSQPARGSTEGGTPIVISGNGFLPVAPLDSASIGTRLDRLGWLARGFGWPSLNFHPTLCPSLAEQLPVLPMPTESLPLQYILQGLYSNGDNTTRMDFSDRDVLQSAITALYSDFPISVFIGSAPCVVTSVENNLLYCTTTSHYDSTVNITVSVLGETATLENVYSYDEDYTPTVVSIAPTSGPVYGGTILTISGSVLEHTTSVTIGDAPCIITSVNSTHVECTTTSHAPSSLPVSLATNVGVARVEMEGSGEELLPQEMPFLFTYELEVNSVGPLVGSVNGGQELTIEGRGFHPSLTTVLIGGRRATVVSADDMDLKCITPAPTERHIVTFTDGGYSIENGFEFAWSTFNTVVRRGDTVTWEWDIEIPGITVNIFQTSEPDSSNPLEGGFSSETSTEGTFSQTFTETGVFYYASELTQQLVVYGQVTVEEAESRGAGIRVFVDGHEAPYVPVDSGSGERDMMMPQRIERRQADGCDDGVLVSSEDETEAAGLTIVYSVCSTPTVTSVTPQSGDVLTTFVLAGSLLLPPLISDTTAVQFDGYDCIIMSNNGTVIECELDLMQMPPSFTNLPLSLTVPGVGEATTTISETTIQLSPVVTALSPVNISTEGGAHLFISGQGFPDEDELTVTVGESPCLLMAQSYTQIQCVTTAGPTAVFPLLISLATDPENPFSCAVDDGCMVAYSPDHTPKVETATPTELIGETTLEIGGSLFSTVTQDNVVRVGEYDCSVTSANASLIQCTLPALPAGDYDISLTVCPAVPSLDSYCPGRAAISTGPLNSPAEITSVSPALGSVAGGTQLTVTGAGFSMDSGDISVIIGEQECSVISSTYYQIECTTTANSPGTYDVMVTSHGTTFPVTQDYTYSMEMTPMVMSVSPNTGQMGTNVTIGGENLGGTTSVDIGGSPCAVDTDESSDTMIMCTLGLNLAGEHNINVNVDGVGMAMVEDSLTFEYDLLLTSFFPPSGSLAGMSSLVLGGMGFNPTEVSVSVCNEQCPLSTSPGSLTAFDCLLPPMTLSSTTTDGTVSCMVSVQSQGIEMMFEEPFIYMEDLTPRVVGINRTRGGTQGGSRILIEGSGFDGGEVTVTIAEVECEIMTSSETEIVCETGASGRTVRAQVMVYVEGKGFAESENITFWYVDLWSSRFTWGNQDPPQEGDFVVVPRGQTLMLDTVTPVLSYLLVQGGALVFDDEAGDDQVGLHTHGMLITSGGKLEVGTEDKPFEAQTEIVLYGDVLSTEIPVYGAKTLALRQGSIDIHGKPLQKTWTRLAETAIAGSTTLRLQEAVDWEVGGKIVIASTSFSQRENEELTIASITSDGLSIVLEAPLEYDHISVRQTFAGREIDTSAEVGYLTRNVVVRGSVNEEFVSEVASCPEEFRTGQFQVQTCFLGRFGAETVGDQFGSQIMIHAPEQNKGDVFGRFSYIEVTHAGQAFRLGRYPIHFHLNGDVTGSYVRGCSIHHTFNRAVTVHAVDNLLVENNVAYNILGHAYFLEDGIEENNIIQDNLGIFVRASSSLLNVDITPAVFWMVNPNNIVRRNAAAGGTHFGFWYRLPVNPTGPSSTFNVFPRQLPLGEFTDNSAHSFGWYGLWVFPEYSPQVPAVFNNFLAWKNERGVEFGVEGGESGALQLHNSTLLDNELAGFEATEIDTAEWGDSLVKDLVIVGHSEVTADDESFCTVAGIKTPHSPYLVVESVTFVNFDREGCTALAACSHCKNLQGGFETRYSDIDLVSSPRLASWQWEHEHYHRDMDGTLTGTGEPSILVPTSPILPPSCVSHAPSSYGAPGSICQGSLDFARFALFDPMPRNFFKFQRINLTNSYGTTNVEYEDKRLLVKDGHMALLPVNESYLLYWQVAAKFTNISYDLLVTQLDEEDYFFIEQPYPQPLDDISVNAKTVNVSESFLDNPSAAETGDWFSDENNTIHFIIRGDNDGDVSVELVTFNCFYEDCLVPPPPTLPPPIPPGRPEVIQSWSDPTIWPGGMLPAEGADVLVNCSWYLLLDVAIPRLGTLTVCGVLEVIDGMDHLIEADIILITGGRLVVGYQYTPFTSKAVFNLHGSRSSPEVTFEPGPILGSKAIGVFGELIMTSVPRLPVWTTLGATVEAGEMEIVVSESVDWEEADEIVITSTSFEGEESETAIISAVSDSGTRITLTSPLQFRHVYETQTIGSRSYTITAEVGLLTRDIVITNGDSEISDRETFGCRVFAGTIEQDGVPFTGTIQMDGVEIKGCGQLGYTEDYDPRFALAARNIIGRGSYVKSSSIHDGYNTGIGVFGSDGFSVTNNVIHNTVGSSIQADGSNLVITGNLGSLSHFLATYRASADEQPANSLWTANFELASTFNLTLRGNVAAGGNKAGFHINGDACTVDGDQLQVADNTAHSTLHGVHLGYQDGHTSGCTHIARFNIHSCFHYAIFSFCPAELRVSGATLVNNNAGVFAAVIGPPSLSHQLGDKQVIIEDSLIVSASTGLDCTRDSVVPRNSLHPQAFSSLRLLSPSGGHVGIIIPVFTSGQGHRTLSGWTSISAYPAISGKTTVRGVTFANFGSRCSDKNDVLVTTHARSEDCNHPTHLSEISHHSNNEDSIKYFNHDPILGSINPSDCVDLDCDGLKHVLVRDEDGSFLETAGARSLVSMAELTWGENGPRGLGNFRIPTAMLATPGGGMEEADALFPSKGIVRGTGDHGDESQCMWSPEWNTYVCDGVNHLMIVIESLDGDTEVRRLSPVGLAANGFIDILNGPMDNGWCGGYTCQERISTFFGIVAAGLSYTMALTSTNPQNMALHLLNAEDSQCIVIAIYYTNPQRLDVYSGGEYVVPNNAMMLENGNLEYQTGTVEDFTPTLLQSHGSNYYDRDRKLLHILVKGDRQYEIRTTPVIQVGLSLEVSVDDFFNEDRLVQNLAFLLGIDSSQIRVVSVVRETTTRRRRQDEETNSMTRIDVEFEIGNPPAATVTMDTTNTTMDNDTMTDNNTSTEAPTTSSTLSFEQLEGITENLVDVIQTGQLTSDINATIVNATVMEPEPEPMDPTNGMRATPDTGGPQPGENGTETLETFSDMQTRMEMVEQNNTEPIVFTIPTELSIEKGPDTTATEGVPLPRQPIIVMFDNFGVIIQNLGLDEAWQVEAVVERGPPGAFLANSTADLVRGRAEFSGLFFSYPGNYRILFTVVFPESAEFSATVEEEVTVVPRDLRLVIATQPENGNTSHPLQPYPTVELWEGGAILRDHDWRNSSWYVRVNLRTDDGETIGSWVEQLSSGYAKFAEIASTDPGEYTLVFTVFTDPSSAHIPARVTSQTFYITQHPLTRLELTYDEDYDTIIGTNDQYLDQFTATFIYSFHETFPSESVELYNVTVTRGSIVVSLFLTSRSARDLVNYVETVTTSNGTFLFTFRGVDLVPETIVQDTAYPVRVPEETEDELILILVTTIPSGTVLLAVLLLILIATLCYRRRRNSQSFKPRTRVGTSNAASVEQEGKYVQHNVGALGLDGNEDEYYLITETEKRLDASMSAVSFQSFEMKDKGASPVSQHDSVVVSKVITVPGGSVVVNPTTTDDREEVGRYVAVPTNGIKPAATVNNGIGGLEKEVEEILTKSGSLVEAESHLK